MDHLIEQCDGIASANHDRKNLNLVIVYENVVSAARALRACDILRGDEPEEINLSIKVWKTDLLGMEDNRDRAAEAATLADIVIVSAIVALCKLTVVVRSPRPTTSSCLNFSVCVEISSTDCESRLAACR